MVGEPSIAPLRTEDLAWLTALNKACLPAVNDLDAGALGGLVAAAVYARSVWRGGQPLGALIAFGPEAEYDSLNFLWFRERFPDFLYIDRVMVDDAARGLGIGQLLYRDIAAFGQGTYAMLACEVNERPPNPGSMRFHEKLGFAVAGRQQTEGGAKSVALLTKPL